MHEKWQGCCKAGKCSKDKSKGPEVPGAPKNAMAGKAWGSSISDFQEI